MPKTKRRIDVYNLIIVQLVLSQQTSAALVMWLAQSEVGDPVPKSETRLHVSDSRKVSHKHNSVE